MWELCKGTHFKPGLSGLFCWNFVLLFLYTQGITKYHNVISHWPVFPFSFFSDNIYSLHRQQSFTVTFYVVSIANFWEPYLKQRARSTEENQLADNWFILLILLLVTEYLLYTHDHTSESKLRKHFIQMSTHFSGTLSLLVKMPL